MKKAALVGLGRWGRNILRELTNLEREVTVVLHSRGAEREAWLTEHFPDASRTYSLDEVVQDRDISHVCIATPMQTHLEVAAPFASTGKKVFVEKPVTDTVASAEEMLSLYPPARLMVGHIFLYHESFARLRRELAGKEIRTITVTKTSRTGERTGGSASAFLDTFIHETSVLLALCGSPKNIYPQEDGLRIEFDAFGASVRVEPPSERKMRRFVFQTGDDRELVWENEDLYEGGSVVFSPSTPALRTELDVFLNRFEAHAEEIAANNRIAVECVRILEKAWLSR